MCVQYRGFAPETMASEGKDKAGPKVVAKGIRSSNSHKDHSFLP